MSETHTHDATLSVVEAAEMLGIGRTLAYSLIRRQAWPTPTIRLGSLIRIPRQPVETLLRSGFTTFEPTTPGKQPPR